MSDFDFGVSRDDDKDRDYIYDCDEQNEQVVTKGREERSASRHHQIDEQLETGESNDCL